MDRNLLNKNYLNALSEKIPNKAKLVNTLIDILNLEKEAVYRRLRGDVAFTFAEIAITSGYLGISLDTIISSTKSSQSWPFQLKLTDYYQPAEADYMMMEEYLNILKEGPNDPNSQLMDCSNTLPIQLCHRYNYTKRLLLFKSLYQSGRTNLIQNFKDVDFNKRMSVLVEDEAIKLKNMGKSSYVLDPLLFQYVVNDIIYFHSIRLIDEDDKQKIKEELVHIAHDMLEMANCGTFKETNKPVNFYIANINFDVSFWFISIYNTAISMLKAFVLSNFSSLENQSLEIMKVRMDALLRSSELISISGERQRYKYFDKQIEIIETL